MSIVDRDDQKNLPVEALIRLFEAVGWSDGGTTDAMKPGFLRPWLCSTLVISAWDGDRLVGAVRVLSDTIFRSVIYDLLVDPPYHGRGIGKELVCQCVAHFSSSEWLVETRPEIAGFYRKLGFLDKKKEGAVHLAIPCKWF